MTLRERLKGWRTVIFGAVMGFASTLLIILDQLQAVNLSGVLPPNVLPYVTLSISVAVILLRVITTTPVGVN